MILSPLKRSAGQSIFQAARPRLVITNIPFWNKSQVRLNFGSKWFVNQLVRFKFPFKHQQSDEFEMINN